MRIVSRQFQSAVGRGDGSRYAATAADDAGQNNRVPSAVADAHRDDVCTQGPSAAIGRSVRRTSSRQVDAAVCGEAEIVGNGQTRRHCNQCRPRSRTQSNSSGAERGVIIKVNEGRTTVQNRSTTIGISSF